MENSGNTVYNVESIIEALFLGYKNNNALNICHCEVRKCLCTSVCTLAINRFCTIDQEFRDLVLKYTNVVTTVSVHNPIMCM